MSKKTLLEKIEMFLGEEYDMKDEEEMEEEESNDSYDIFFKAKMKEWGIDNITDLSDEEKKKFFNEVDKEWKAEEE